MPPQKRNPILISCHCPDPGSHQSVFCLYDLPPGNTSYKWDHIVFILFWLVSFTCHVFKAHPYCSLYQYFIPFYSWIIFLYGYTASCLSTHWWTFGLLILNILSNIYWPCSHVYMKCLLYCLQQTHEGRYYEDFTEEASVTQRNGVTCPAPHSRELAEAGLETMAFWSQGPSSCKPGMLPRPPGSW